MRVRSLLCISAGLIVVAVSAKAQTQIPSMDELHAAAKKEGGTVTFAGAIKGEHVTKLSAAFTKRYPGVTVKYTRRATEPMVQLVEAERRANRVSFDVLNLTEPGDVVRWMKEGFLASVPIPDADMRLPNTFDPKGYYAATGVTPMLGIYNTRVLKAGEVPKSLKALVNDPRWKGKIAISRPTRGGTSGGALMNVVGAVGRDLLKIAPQRDILIVIGNESAISAVVSGERTISWGVSGYRAIEAKADGAPIQTVVWEEGVALVQFIGVVPAKAPRPNAARLFYRWLMTPEGQELLVTTANFYSARKDVAVTPLKEPPLSAMRINYFSTEKIVNEGHALALEFDKAMGL